MDNRVFIVVIVGIVTVALLIAIKISEARWFCLRLKNGERIAEVEVGEKPNSNQSSD